MRETNLPAHLVFLLRGSFAACLGLMLGACAHDKPRLVAWSTGTPSLYLGNCYAPEEEQTPWTDLLPRQALSLSFRPDFQADKKGDDWDRLHHCLYSAELGVMGEKRLWPAASDAESYRFTWLRSFHAPVVIRVERSGPVFQLHAKQLDGVSVAPGGAVTGKFAVDHTRLLTPEESSQVVLALKAANFWGLTPRHSQGDHVVYSDGASWLLEGTRAGHYRAYNVHSPESEGEAGAFRAACLKLVQLAGLAIREDEVY
ncbi:hypothetical protein HPC49_10315 [Pyxidicoccus fallax]|uniref:Lipoprotein n=1 Tax=Pyxidicoccus fallax TaxID=394095 RepID=A0A848LIW1_9BACT|nr:hypothetical protein [Pyxidicoccus fallax]NMO17675.1 hypothetical protein [Pyxidicoccus fallax]NPC78636.1 hypothetical protein [Pyxidicoccus fallax]